MIEAHALFHGVSACALQVVRAFLKRFLTEDHRGQIGTITITGSLAVQHRGIDCTLTLISDLNSHLHKGIKQAANEHV